MPELPEVETMRLGLEKYLVGDSIEDIEIRFPKLFSGDPEEIKGSSVIAVRRFGKGLVIDLNNKKSLTIHVKMTGQLVYIGSKIPAGNTISKKAGESLPHKHTHVIFKLNTPSFRHPELDSGSKKMPKQVRHDLPEAAYLYYSDIRKFGWIKIIDTDKLFDVSFFKNLGFEPLKDLTLEKFENILKSKKVPIKSLLMDQSLIAGVGNIYANDALYLAKINPSRSAGSLSNPEIVRLFDELEKVLRKGIEVGGASERNYVNSIGGVGRYQDFFQVYGKVGKKCVECGSIIEKITIGGRGTFFCPSCQV